MNTRVCKQLHNLTNKNALCQIWGFVYIENEFEFFQGVGIKKLEDMMSQSVMLCYRLGN